MKRKTWKLFLLPVASTPAWAHEAPGQASNHWHASDTLGFLFAALAVMAAWMWWRSRR